jgi:hypothetical protein
VDRASANIGVVDKVLPPYLEWEQYCAVVRLGDCGEGRSIVWHNHIVQTLSLERYKCVDIDETSRAFSEPIRDSRYHHACVAMTHEAYVSQIAYFR